LSYHPLPVFFADSIGLEQERELRAVGRLTDLFDNSAALYLLTIINSTAHLNIAYRHGDHTFKNINTLERMIKRTTKILNAFL